MTDTVPGIRESHELQDLHRRERLAVLAQAARLADEHRLGEIMPMVMANYMNDPSTVGRITLIQLDEVMFHTKYRTAKRWVRRVRERLHDGTRKTDGRLDLAWALESREATVRMVTWLWMIGRREHLVSFGQPGGFPYSLLYDNWDPAYDGTLEDADATDDAGDMDDAADGIDTDETGDGWEDME